MFWVHLIVTALAQEPAEAAPTFVFDQVLVTTFQAQDPADQAEADRLHARLAARIATHHDVIPMDAVPGFGAQQVAASYIHGCPPGQYSGCALVLGQRALADWVVGATLHHEVDDFDPDDAHTSLTVHLVDVTDAREISTFTVSLVGDEEITLQGVVDVFDKMREGAFELRDLRDTSSEERAAIEAARRQLMGAYLEELEIELGDLTPSEPLEPVAPPKVTSEDLDRFADDDDIPAWERVRLSRRAYLRFRNSGLDLETFRSLARGRQGTVIVRGAAGAGRGPWDHRYTSQLLRSAEDLQPVHALQFLEIANGSTITLDLDLGIGVLPTLDLALVGGLHVGTAETYREERVEDQFALPASATSDPKTTYNAGLRATFAPFPQRQVRPIMTSALVWWQGAGIMPPEPFPSLEGSARLVWQAMPGLEVDTAARVVSLFLRGGVEVPLTGARVQQTEVGTGFEDPLGPTGEHGIGWVVQAGLQVRVRPFTSSGPGASNR